MSGNKDPVFYKDGKAYAHQFVLGKHSRFLKDLLSSDHSLSSVRLIEPKMPGLKKKLKVNSTFNNHTNSNDLYL